MNILTRIFNSTVYGLSIAHLWVGLGLVIFSRLTHTPPYVNLLYTLFLGITHELGDGDLLTASNSPLEGIKDILIFLPPAIINLFL
jgi:hypothetical protein